MANNLNYIDELLILIGADATNLLQDTERVTKEVQQKYEEMAGNVDKSVKKGIVEPLEQANQATKKSGGFISGFADSIKSKLGPAKKYFEELSFAGGNTVQTLIGFAQGSVSISTVIKSLGSLTSAFGPVGVAAALGLGVVLNTLKKVGEAVNQVWSMMSPDVLENLGVATASSFEQYETQFKVFLGSAEKAKVRLAEYADFGAKTPYELPEIVEAGKMLEQYGGAALSTGKSLKMVGDMASAVDRPINVVGMHVARIYSAIKSGGSFGESARQLQMMGLLSGEASEKIKALQESGASAEEVWAEFTTTMSKFDGMMEEQAKTYKGITSNVEDFNKQIALVGATPIFDGKKAGLQKQYDFLEKNKSELKGMALAIGGIQSAFNKLAGAFKRGILENINYEQFEKIANSIWEIIDLLTANKLSDAFSLPELLAADINGIANGVAFVAEKGAEVARTWAQVGAFMNAGKAAIWALGSAIVEVFKSLNGFNLKNLITGNLPDLNTTMTQISDIMSKGLAEAETSAVAAFKESADAISAADAKRKSYTDTLLAEKAATEAVTEAEKDNTEGQKTADALKKYSDQLLNIQLEHDKQSSALQENYEKELIAISEDAHKQALAIEEKFNEGKSELAKEYTDQKAEIEKNRAYSSAKIEEDYRATQKEEEKAYQKQMKDIKNQYLYDLEEAVKNRDARAIVDLRKGYSRQKTEATTNYQEQQKKNSENLAKQKAEAEKSYQEQLAKLEQTIAEKQIKLEESYNKEHKDLVASSQEKEKAALTAYQNQQAQLDGALARQLEAIMIAMEAEKQLTADQAKQILETLAETFGIDGDIDKLMEEFSKRQKMRMEIDVKIKKVTDTLVGGEGGDTPSPTGTPAPAGSTGVPFFATGGLMLARKPTLVQVGEAGPELFSATPISALSRLNSNGGGNRNQIIELKFSGSAPPGIGGNEREQIAGVLMDILSRSGVTQKVAVRR